MAYVLLNSGGDRDYHNAVLTFLEDIEGAPVRGVVMVAITDDGPFLSWCSTPMDFMTAASVVQAQATKFYLEGDLCEDGD